MITIVQLIRTNRIDGTINKEQYLALLSEYKSLIIKREVNE